VRPLRSDGHSGRGGLGAGVTTRKGRGERWRSQHGRRGGGDGHAAGCHPRRDRRRMTAPRVQRPSPPTSTAMISAVIPPPRRGSLRVWRENSDAPPAVAGPAARVQRWPAPPRRPVPSGTPPSSTTSRLVGADAAGGGGGGVGGGWVWGRGRGARRGDQRHQDRHVIGPDTRGVGTRRPGSCFHSGAVIPVTRPGPTRAAPTPPTAGGFAGRRGAASKPGVTIPGPVAPCH
jgi:hypothetical protein